MRSVGRQEDQKPEVLYKGYKNIRQWRIRQWEGDYFMLLFAPLDQLALSGTSVDTISNNGKQLQDMNRIQVLQKVK